MIQIVKEINTKIFEMNESNFISLFCKEVFHIHFFFFF